MVSKEFDEDIARFISWVQNRTLNDVARSVNSEHHVDKIRKLSVDSPYGQTTQGKCVVDNETGLTLSMSDLIYTHSWHLEDTELRRTHTVGLIALKDIFKEEMERINEQ